MMGGDLLLVGNNLIALLGIAGDVGDGNRQLDI
jgi:hypothetical protein